MNKTIVIIVGTLVLAIGGYFIGISLKNDSSLKTADLSFENSVTAQPEQLTIFLLKRGNQ
jgi:hypothetical protein